VITKKRGIRFSAEPGMMSSPLISLFIGAVRLTTDLTKHHNVREVGKNRAGFWVTFYKEIEAKNQIATSPSRMNHCPIYSEIRKKKRKG
jgi:hypothetical protein